MSPTPTLHERRPGRLFAVAIACLAMLTGGSGEAAATSPSDAASAPRQLTKSIALEPNRGQTDESVRFIVRGGDYTVFLTATEAVFAPRGRPDAAASAPDVVRMKFVGANPSSAVTASNALPGKVNYVPGTGPDARLTGIPTYGKVRYAGVYRGIDLVYFDNDGRLEYDFVVEPGADPGVIALAFDGARAVDIDDDGALVLRTSTGELRQPAPFVYQQRGGDREQVASRWVKSDGHVAFRVGTYDRTRPLVIDPLLVYSSYLGGRGDDSGMDIALDAAGNMYIAGGTTSPNFPGTAPRGSTSDAAFVSKLTAAGQLLYSTYLLDTDERGATGIAVDPVGNAYVTGRTSLWRATASNDVFVAKLDAFGRTARPYGYFFTFGGDRIDAGNRIAVDVSGYAYVVGRTAGGSFPTTAGAFRRVPAGENDAFVAKVNVGGTGLVFSTLLGGSGEDSANDIARDIAGNIYVTGSTQSIDFPTTAGAYQRQHRGCYTTWTVMCAKTVFVTKVNAWGTGLVYSTYLGGTGYDQESYAEGIAVDGAGNAYVVGATTADNFPTTSGVVQPNAGYPLCYYEVCSDAFVTKLNASGSALVYSTYLMGEAQDYANGIAVDSAGNAYVAGGTSSRYFPIVNAFQPKGGSYEDAFVAKLNPTASRLLYSSYLGGSGTGGNFAGASSAVALAVDGYGQAHVTGLTYATTFPTSSGAAQRVSGGCNSTIYPCADGFVTKIAASGAGVTQAITVSMTSTRATIGNSITVTWSGIPAPSPWDTIHLYPLGQSDEPYEVWGGWYTTGAAAGTVQLWLPPGLDAGWYEARLWSGTDVYGPLARSSPFQVFPF